MVSYGSTNPTREIEIGHLITHRVWKRYTVHPRGPHGEVKSGCRQGRRGRTWGMYLC